VGLVGISNENLIVVSVTVFDIIGFQLVIIRQNEESGWCGVSIKSQFRDLFCLQQFTWVSSGLFFSLCWLTTNCDQLKNCSSSSRYWMIINLIETKQISMSNITWFISQLNFFVWKRLGSCDWSQISPKRYYYCIQGLSYFTSMLIHSNFMQDSCSLYSPIFVDISLKGAPIIRLVTQYWIGNPSKHDKMCIFKWRKHDRNQCFTYKNVTSKVFFMTKFRKKIAWEKSYAYLLFAF